MNSKTVEMLKGSDNMLRFIHSMPLPPRILALTLKLGAKAQREKKFRFYTLYHHICMPDVLETAWRAVVKNKGAAGVDGVTIDQIRVSQESETAFLKRIQEQLTKKTYKPQPIRRVFIRKPNGKMRPLGIPTMADRVVQSAVVIVLTPIFEQDFLECSYGFRPKRGTHDALKAIMKHIKEGRVHVYDADISGYFDNISHEKLIKAIKFRIADSAVLKLIRSWLKCVILDKTPDGIITASRSNKGTPQGGVISPLLANIYLHWFDVQFSWTPDAKNENAVLVRYADDFVILLKRKQKNLYDWVNKTLAERFELQLNKEKSKQIDLYQNSLDFLGYTFSNRTGRSFFGGSSNYWRLEPSKKSVLREYESLRKFISPKFLCVPVQELVDDVNAHIRGWGNYYCLGNPYEAFAKIDRFLQDRFRKHLLRKSQRSYKRHRGQGIRKYLTEEFGLIEIAKLFSISNLKRAGCGKSTSPVR